jgi:hypothetical protein
MRFRKRRASSPIRSNPARWSPTPPTGSLSRPTRRLQLTALALSNCTTVQRRSLRERRCACAAVRLTLNGAQISPDCRSVSSPPAPRPTSSRCLRAVSAAQNPAPIACISPAAVEFRVVEKPVIDRFEPSLDLRRRARRHRRRGRSRTPPPPSSPSTAPTPPSRWAPPPATHAARSKCVDLPVKGHKLDLCAQCRRRRCAKTRQSSSCRSRRSPPPTRTLAPRSSCDADGTNKLLIVPRPTVTVADPPFACAGTTVDGGAHRPLLCRARGAADPSARRRRPRRRARLTRTPRCRRRRASRSTRRSSRARSTARGSSSRVAADALMRRRTSSPSSTRRLSTARTPAGVELLVVPLTDAVGGRAGAVGHRQRERPQSDVCRHRFHRDRGRRRRQAEHCVVARHAVNAHRACRPVALDGCAPLAHKQRTLNVCTRMTVTLPSASALKQDDIRVYDVAVAAARPAVGDRRRVSVGAAQKSPWCRRSSVHGAAAGARDLR